LLCWGHKQLLLLLLGFIQIDPHACCTLQQILTTISITAAVESSSSSSST
jgi:hypothetical protein